LSRLSKAIEHEEQHLTGRDCLAYVEGMPPSADLISSRIHFSDGRLDGLAVALNAELIIEGLVDDIKTLESKEKQYLDYNQADDLLNQLNEMEQDDGEEIHG